MGCPADILFFSASKIKLSKVLSEGFPCPDESSAMITTPSHERVRFEARRLALTEFTLYSTPLAFEQMFVCLQTSMGFIQLTARAQVRNRVLEVLVDAAPLPRLRVEGDHVSQRIRRESAVNLCIHVVRIFTNKPISDRRECIARRIEDHPAQEIAERQPTPSRVRVREVSHFESQAAAWHCLLCAQGGTNRTHHCTC